MKTTLRLALSALAISFITLAAAGAPLPFLAAPASNPPTPSRLLPPGADGAPGVATVVSPIGSGFAIQ